MDGRSLESRVEELLHELLQPRNRAQLEKYRHRGSTNRVYFIPLRPGGNDSIVVKLRPHPRIEIAKRLKRILRNMFYGENIRSLGRLRATNEIERTREWMAAGLPVAPLIETTLPHVRVFKWLPYPTFYTVLSDKDLSVEGKLHALEAVTRALSHQHQLALHRGKKNLVHWDPGPWNIMYDPATDSVYWFDLEHPADHPGMTIEALMARAVRIFLYGVLDHLPDRFDDVMRVFLESYGNDRVLRQFVESMETNRPPLVVRFLREARGHTRSYRQRYRMASVIAAALQTRASSGRVGGMDWNLGGER